MFCVHFVRMPVTKRRRVPSGSVIGLFLTVTSLICRRTGNAGVHICECFICPADCPRPQSGFLKSAQLVSQDTIGPCRTLYTIKLFINTGFLDLLGSGSM